MGVVYKLPVRCIHCYWYQKVVILSEYQVMWEVNVRDLRIKEMYFRNMLS